MAELTHSVELEQSRSKSIAEHSNAPAGSPFPASPRSSSHATTSLLLWMLQVFKAYPEPHELLLKIAVPEAPVVTLKKNKATIQLKATAEVVVIHHDDVQKFLCLLNIVRIKQQLCRNATSLGLGCSSSA